jgi:hypothetical protein
MSPQQAKKIMTDEANDVIGEVQFQPEHRIGTGMHATYWLGIDHTKLTYRYNGRDFRLTHVAGSVIHDISA